MESRFRVYERRFRNSAELPPDRICDGERRVAYYNDSKGTNPDAAIKAVEAMNRPTILIGGGYDKNSSYDEWIDSFGEKVRYLVLVGATKEKIAETARRKGFDNVILADTFEEAVMESARLAREGRCSTSFPCMCEFGGMFKKF